eukprot:TRINITY_DN2971_c0_g1_i4.p2 TRINITY_DN2971_c0_g1~~TRINITY_DN2971_c0_g1_i4.p2  ORF type:complete len:131 (-),score=25.50 TRINITY_DN2971_c0_g1_i4:80-472(-)
MMSLGRFFKHAFPTLPYQPANCACSEGTFNHFQTYWSCLRTRLGNVGTESKQLANKVMRADITTNDVKTGAKLGIQLYILYFIGSIVGNGICGVTNAQLGEGETTQLKQDLDKIAELEARAKSRAAASRS